MCLSPFTHILNRKNIHKKILFAHSHYSNYFNYFFSLFFSSFSFISSQPSLSSHFLLHLPFKFVYFPPSLICTSPSTIDPIQPFYRPSSPISTAHSIDPVHRSSSTPHRPNSPTQMYSTTRRRPSLSLQFLTLANPSRGFAVFNVGFEFNDLWV